MRNIIYHVAVSLDGYIAHPDHSATGFSFEGPHVTAFFEHLKTYDTVIMGRGTYEAGYQYGLKPGDTPYPTMRNFVFSQSLTIADNDRLKIVRSQWLDTVDMLKSESGSDIYLCGGGKLAGSLLAEGWPQFPHAYKPPAADIAENNVRRVIAHTLGEENASNKVLRKNGFEFASESTDPDHGPIWQWTIAKSRFFP